MGSPATRRVGGVSPGDHAGYGPAVLQRLVHRVRRADEQLFARAAASHSPALDAVLPRLTRAADHGALWAVTPGALALTGRSGRRAATRGLLSLGLASAVVNGPAKLLFR